MILFLVALMVQYSSIILLRGISKIYKHRQYRWLTYRTYSYK